MTDITAWNVPAHIPAELVVDFDIFDIPPGLKDPLDKWHSLVKAGVPKIFWSPRNGGHWTFLAYEDIRDGYRTPELFSSRNTPIPPVESWPVFQPQSVDPPGNAKFRHLLAPLFTPVAIGRMKNEVQRRARALIDIFAARGSCDFVRDFSAQLPTGMFLHLMAMDETRLDEFTALADTFMRVENPDEKARNVEHIYAVLEELIAQRRAGPLGEDIMSALLSAREPDGRPFPHEEIINCVFLLFVAGLDTVTSTMTYIWRYLARTPAARRYLIENLTIPEKLSRAVDELFRINAVSNIYRRVANDIVFKGIAMKADDKLVLPNTVANRDPAVFASPEVIDLDRKINAHLTFGVGAHRCIGSHLAKTEVIVALQEWLPRIADFRIDEGVAVDIFAGPVMGFRSLPLLWDVSR